MFRFCFFALFFPLLACFGDSSSTLMGTDASASQSRVARFAEGAERMNPATMLYEEYSLPEDRSPRAGTVTLEDFYQEVWVEMQACLRASSPFHLIEWYGVFNQDVEGFKCDDVSGRTWCGGIFVPNMSIVLDDSYFTDQLLVGHEMLHLLLNDLTHDSSAFVLCGVSSATNESPRM